MGQMHSKKLAFNLHQQPDMGVPGCLITHPHSPRPDLVGRAPFTEDEGSPRKLLIFLFHWRTMLETERAPDSGSEEVVLAETSAPESSMAGFWLVLPATRSDMGLARRRSAETCPEERQRVSDSPNLLPSPPGPHGIKSGSSGDPNPQGHSCPMGFSVLPHSPSPAARLSCPKRPVILYCLQPSPTWLLSHKNPPTLLVNPLPELALTGGQGVSEPSAGARTPKGPGAIWRQTHPPAHHLLSFPPQHYFLLPLLRLQSPDLKLHKRERERDSWGPAQAPQ